MINPSLGIGCNEDWDIPSGHLTTFRLSREVTQDISPMSERDGYIHAKWRKFLRNEKTKKKKKPKDLRDYQKSMKN
mgnify:CR=1 FL=1